MRSLRIAIAGAALVGLTLAGGCRTEKSTKTTEVTRAGGDTTVKTHEKHESEHGKSEKIEKRTYHD
jgi:hypothetical protein